MEKAEVAAPQLEEALKSRRELPLWIGVWGRVIKEKPLATFGLAIVSVFLFAGVFANFVAPEGLNEPHPERLKLIETETGVTKEFLGPSLIPFHPMGLDQLGRDMLSRVIFGARTSMIVGLGTVAIGTTLAIVLGMASAWFGGRVDTLIQRFVDAMMAFPWLLFILVIVTLLPTQPPIDLPGGAATWGMLKVIFALAILDIAWVSRVIRSASMTVRENQYVDAARAVGCSGWRINTRYILPNIMAPIITLATLNLGYAILSEAFLSFLGQGIPPPNPSWGGMLSGLGKTYQFRAPWIAFFPGLMITVVIFGINILGDGLRDLLDPRLRGKSGRYSS